MALENENPNDLAAPLENEGAQAPIAEPKDNEERLYNAKQVSDIVARERQKALEKGRSEALMEMQQTQQQQQPTQQQEAPQQPAQVTQSQTSLGGMQTLSPEQVQQMMQQELPKYMEQHYNQLKQEQAVNSFVQKMKAAEEAHPGLEQELNQLNWRDPRTSALVMMANDLENTGDIMRELLDHPSKFGDVLNLVDSQPHLAAKQLYALSNSIKQNQTAAMQNKRAQEPLSQIKPSLNAGMDDGSMSVSDFRKMRF